MHVNQIITNRIIDKLAEAEQTGTTYYWVRPFAQGSPNIPYSYAGSVPYHGINRILLDSDEYLTYKKMLEISSAEQKRYSLRKGAKANIAVYFNTIVETDAETGEPLCDGDGKPVVRGFVKYYKVFSRQDVVDENGVNLPSKFNFERYSHEEMSAQIKQTVDLFHRLINYYCKKYGIKVEVAYDGTRAFFQPSVNRIRFPHISGFSSVYEYMGTIAHELIHSTMIPLKRNLSANVENYKAEYSKEELVAEIGAEMLLQNLCVPDDREHKENSIAYLQGWSKFLEDRPNELISAAAKAENACQLILDCLRELEINREHVQEKGEDR